MPVEDIDFLKKNSIKENFVFIVDSKQRDRRAYPDASEYVVEFEAPFRNVIGLNLVDASIPRTMYNIDVYNNELSYYIYNTGEITDTTVFQKVALETGDYTIQTLIVELNAKLKMLVNGIEIGITASSMTNPPDIKNRIQFKCPYKFAFDMRNSTISESLGFDGHVRKQSTDKNYDIIATIDNPQLFHSSHFAFDKKDAYTMFEGPKGVIRTLNLVEGKVAQPFYVPYPTNVVKVYAALNDIGEVAFSIQKDVSGNPSGISLATGSIVTSFVDGSYSDSSDLAYAFFEGNARYWVVFEKAESDVKIFYNDVLETDLTLKTYKNDIWSTIEGFYYQLSIRIDVADDYNRIRAQGIYSLVGERYIILRCKEIEENSHRSLSYTKNPTGIAKFTLGIVGYSEERLDYASVPSREFHPIGKLSRLTFRFETQKGQLYDFKDVNHTLTFSIKYLEAVGKTEFTSSIINSNYNGDFMKYQYSQEEQEEDSDDQETDYNEDDFEKYRSNESRNLPWQVAQRNIQLYYDLNYGDD
jgi:hypothetical protein